jgi:two-component system response regulator QseB
MRILLAEDDKDLGNLISNALRKNRNVVDWVRDGQAALSALTTKNDEFDVAILDLGLPKKDGLAVLTEARKQNVRTPVMILTARDTIDDRVKGLDSGGDDYLTKPFDLDELGARLRALQRRALSRAESTIKYLNLILNPASHVLTIDDAPVSLPRREFVILQKLLENVGHVVTRESLAQTLYGWNEEMDSNTLEVHIHNIRKKLGVDWIRTIRGVGYLIDKASP